MHENSKLSKFLNQCQDIFTDDILGVVTPKQEDDDHAIELLPGSSPPNKPPYRVSQTQQEEIMRQVNELVEKGMARPSSSPFCSSPVLLMQKKDDAYCMCVDDRALNWISIKNRFHVPQVEDQFYKLQGLTYFSRIDLKSGYHQIRIVDEDIVKTTFCTTFGLYECLVMPFGLRNALATFNCTMEQIFQPYRNFTEVFFDNVIIYSKSTKEHKKHLQVIFQALRDNKLFIKQTKSDFFLQEIQYLGHIISQFGIRMDPLKLEVPHIRKNKKQSTESSRRSAKYVPKAVKTTSSAASSRSTRSKKSSSDDERIDTDKERDSQESDQEDILKEVEAAGPSKYERSDEEDTSTPLEKKSQKPRSREQVLMDKAMARVEARRKELADARAAKAAKIARPTTMEEARKLRIEKAKAIQKERKRLEAEEKAQEEAEVAQATQTQENEVIDLSGTVEYLKKIEKEKHTAKQRAAQLAREKIKEALSRKAEEQVLEPSQGSPKRPRQEEEEEIEHIQADPIPSSPMNIPPAPPFSLITPFPLASTPKTPPSPSPLDLPRSPPVPTSPQ
ncbi:hypothetical protein L7F22_060063 [Adiantum nelumboides]|nr:hypothetical protein [Adiantum nelumboides]